MQFAAGSNSPLSARSLCGEGPAWTQADAGRSAPILRSTSPGGFGGGASLGERRGRTAFVRHTKVRRHPAIQSTVNEYPENAEKGPDPYDPRIRRKNIITAFVVMAGVALFALVPATMRRFQQPVSIYATHAEAVADRAVDRGDVPRFIPASATQIHARHNRDTGQRFVRFDYPPAELPAFVRGMQRLQGDKELERVPVPSPGWSKWWLITSRTLTGGQAEYLQVYRIPSGPDRGYLAVDPRTLHGYYWSR
jgi:hypothetical protein